ncbi:HNH endonuclease signature motif containing protein [Mycolicibacterium aubagnense]
MPLWVDPATLLQCERDLVAAARCQAPEELRRAAADLVYRLDQDGPEPEDDEPAPKRSFVVGKQQPDGRCGVNGTLDPEARAYWQAVSEKLAAPGMCNPADEVPRLSGTPTQAQIDNDTRSLAQREHDAFTVVCRLMLSPACWATTTGCPCR